MFNSPAPSPPGCMCFSFEILVLTRCWRCSPSPLVDAAAGHMTPGRITRLTVKWGLNIQTVQQVACTRSPMVTPYPRTQGPYMNSNSFNMKIGGLENQMVLIRRWLLGEVPLKMHRNIDA